jgi:arsenical pump membrane protein
MLALAEVPGAGMRESLAALVGGDIGPRLLPMGSLAGLLWLSVLRRLGIEVSTVRFAVVGALITVPALTLSVALLTLLCR